MGNTIWDFLIIPFNIYNFDRFVYNLRKIKIGRSLERRKENHEYKKECNENDVCSSSLYDNYE